MQKIILFLIIGITMQTSNTLAASSYLALGDSYTIGEGVAVIDSWPYQLVKKLNAKGISIEQPKVIARTGWRTDNLIAAIEAENLSQKYDLVSLLIGVNNQFQGKSLEQYKKDLRSLLNTAINLSAAGKSRVFVLSIPDYGSTPLASWSANQLEKK
ncbi:MAG: SGNH/GDSL hydrolase family protein [Crocinitomicaceae bacterium]|nr:SGNH/GDSL hydrolase family protein [Crocinitomicaceae bacterium]